VTSLPRSQALRNNSNFLSEEGLGRRKSKVELNNIYEFALDHVFRDSHSNWEVYSECCAQVVGEFLQGNNSTIFMYGQTTSGKTYTMLGDAHHDGLIIYSLRDIFARKHPGDTISISYLEIYNEQINDLLQPSALNLKIVDEHVQGLSHCPVTHIDQALQLLNEGECQRAYAEKKCHDHSSRSHTIFQVVLLPPPRKSWKTNIGPARSSTSSTSPAASAWRTKRTPRRQPT
jgi:hypothetical protein